MGSYIDSDGNRRHDNGTLISSHPGVDAPYRDPDRSRMKARQKAILAERERRSNTTTNGYGTSVMIYIVAFGLLHLACTGGLVARPQTVLVRFILWYQQTISNGRNVCPKGAGHNCSSVSLEAIRRHGALRGGLIMVRTVLSCKREQRHATTS
jgi:putative component of membrane protein insertase Oxa1/YidC/SpoIIIJ protein YidD